MAGSITRNRLSLPQQYLFLQRSKTISGEGVLGPGRLEWRFRAQPTPLSRSYQVTLVLERDGTPEVRVVDPDLRLLAGGRDLPHIYHDPDRLCLYLPGTGQWDAGKRLDLTIIPWTYLWLIYFEEWLVSDDWKGGGKHPGEDDPDEGNRALRRSLRRMH
ncbi:hypothetical protein OB2597_17992 [Pseudooceanicola batsensis HTCC2597]|uniref:Type II CBASS E2 protein domain-containing protein n=1 Tax=Pseudooceanicola batsensis (strain ATCC BAA-863 / DSM 15984 / KCTC 12145 / HTCC2597) TaxID=252305 RepID=A3U002_PSEBH|nr:hypothetical protein [Pseudooceanicola batsensis]EAQ02633.1 hypothetical protein OB2597_17992 [Pseudooceanicola batsensis HTCC2597]